MFLVTNQAKNTQVVIINKKEIHFPPLVPVELEKISAIEMGLLNAVPMYVQDFEVPSVETVRVENTKAEVEEGNKIQAPVEIPVQDNKISLSNGIPLSDGTDVSSNLLEGSDKAMSGLKSFGRKKK